MLIPILLVALAAACTSGSSYGRDLSYAPVLVNRTDHALVYAAFNLADAGLVDPNPAIDPADAPERTVPAREERAVEIPDYANEGLLLFIYDIPANHTGPVQLSRTLQVTPEELARAQGRIVIENQ